MEKPLKVRMHRDIESKVRSITISLTPSGKVYVSVLVEKGIKVRNQRVDFLHKLSPAIIHENQVVVVEDLHVNYSLMN